MAIQASTISSFKNLKKSLAKKSSGLISWIPKDGDRRVRLLDDPEDDLWVKYIEVYDPAIEASYPLPEDPTPHQRGLRPSTRYLVNAVDLDTDTVIALQLPVTLANPLSVKYEKVGTLTDRDYEFSRSGTGKETSYTFDFDAPTKRNLSKYERLDLMAILEQVYAEAMGEAADDEYEDDEDEAPKKTASKSRAAAKADDDEEYEDEPDEVEESEYPDENGLHTVESLEALTLTELKELIEEYGVEDFKGRTAKAVETVLELQAAYCEENGLDNPAADLTEEAEEEAEDVPDEVEEEDEFWKEEDLEPLTIGQLREIADEYEIDHDGMKKADLIAAIVADE